jgi:LmbE family N-acetylglucosaminyl deacetylase
VFGCAGLIARHPGAVVVTVFAGGPPRGTALTPWDALAGFRPGDDVVAARRAEDRVALGVLGARPVWLDFWDAQYGPSPDAAAVTGALWEAVAGILDGWERRARVTLALPLGLFHSDHHLAHEACLALLRQRPALRAVAYEDALYRRIPGLVEERLARLAAGGVRIAGAENGGDVAGVKRAAVARYRSQLRALRAPGKPGLDDLRAPERYWRLRRA